MRHTIADPHGLIEKLNRIRRLFSVSDLKLGANNLPFNLLYCLQPVLEPFPCWLALTLQALHTHVRFGAIISLYPFETGDVLNARFVI